MGKGFLIVCVVSLSSPLWAQKLRKADKVVAANIAIHVNHMTSDTGTCSYLSGQFEHMGLRPDGDQHSFQQTIRIDEGKTVGTTCALTLDGKSTVALVDFFPLVGSPNAHAKGSAGISLNESGLPWIYDLKYDLESGRENPAFDIRQTLLKKAVEAQQKGATALLLYNSSKLPDSLTFDAQDSQTTYPLPIIFINKKLSRRAFKDPTAYVDIDLTVSTEEKITYLHNVKGYIDNKAGRTVVLETSLDTPSSAIAALIELARLVKQSGWKRFNYLVLAFSHNSEGSTLDTYFSAHPTVSRDSVAYVLNMDELGNPDPSLPELKVTGLRMSDAWQYTLHELKDPWLQIMMDTTSKLTMPTEKIPVGSPLLCFSTRGDHSPSLVFNGEALVIRYIYKAMEMADKK